MSNNPKIISNSDGKLKAKFKHIYGNKIYLIIMKIIQKK